MNLYLNLGTAWEQRGGRQALASLASKVSIITSGYTDGVFVVIGTNICLSDLNFGTLRDSHDVWTQLLGSFHASKIHQ